MSAWILTGWLLLRWLLLGWLLLPTQSLPREVEDFPRGDKYFKHVPPPTYLIYFSPKEYT